MILPWPLTTSAELAAMLRPGGRLRPDCGPQPIHRGPPDHPSLPTPPGIEPRYVTSEQRTRATAREQSREAARPLDPRPARPLQSAIRLLTPTRVGGGLRRRRRVPGRGATQAAPQAQRRRAGARGLRSRLTASQTGAARRGVQRWRSRAPRARRGVCRGGVSSLSRRSS